MDRDDLKKVYEYQIYMTTFADTKAGGFILLFTGILSGLLSSGKLAYATAMLSGNLALSNVVSVCAFLSLLGSLGLLTWTIIPRSVPAHEKALSVIFWRHIARDASGSAYLARLRQLDGDAWAAQWAEQIHSVASIASIKFARLRDAVWLGLFGSFLMVCLFVIT